MSDGKFLFKYKVQNIIGYISRHRASFFRIDVCGSAGDRRGKMATFDPGFNFINCILATKPVFSRTNL